MNQIVKPILIGAAIGAVAGWLMGASQAKGGGAGRNPLGVTGQFARPFQYGIDTGKMGKGG
jgi:hypothetical protein